MRPNPVKRALKAGQPAIGTWLSLGSITAARFLARTGFQWLTVDIEHSLVDWETATHMFASIADAHCTPLARVPANRHDHIKRVLDNGAMGVVVPMVNTREDAQRLKARAGEPALRLRREYYDMVKYALLSPIYWAFMSVAAWKGFLQLFYKPSYWEKTEHGLYRGRIRLQRTPDRSAS